MSHKHELREQRTGTVINKTSLRQEGKLKNAVCSVQERLQHEFPGIQLNLRSQWNLKDIVKKLKNNFPDVKSGCYHATSSMRPDGGILEIFDRKGISYPILISEIKNQGTNDALTREGKPTQAKGNAIERLGKNVIGFRAALLHEGIFPFVCFGDGCDFAPGSTILDRVVTIAMFGPLNEECLYNNGSKNLFNRGSFYFREKKWTEEEMAELSYSIAEKSVRYYFDKYGKDTFIPLKK